MNSIIGVDEISIFSPQHDIYPLIDPKSHFESKTFKDKVVIVTGGSTGIGATTALFYAKAGAKVVINARRVQNLEASKATIEKEVPGAEIVLVGGDIADPEVGKSIVKAAVDTWKRLDIVVANSAIAAGAVDKLADRDAFAWWRTQEVNVRGTLNIVHPAIPELLKSKGQIVVTTSAAAHLRMPLMGDYNISKHTLNRFTEILALDYPEVPIYTIHPGAISTPGAIEFQEATGLAGHIPMPDQVELPAATFLWLTAGNANFLSGRYLQANWDLNEVLAKKEEIVRGNLLVTKLAGPKKSV